MCVGAFSRIDQRKFEKPGKTARFVLRGYKGCRLGKFHPLQLGPCEMAESSRNVRDLSLWQRCGGLRTAASRQAAEANSGVYSHARRGRARRTERFGRIGQRTAGRDGARCCPYAAVLLSLVHAMAGRALDLYSAPLAVRRL
ncbi:unnamed protein product [Phaeothamnion confervicola]